jgi:predicted AlkP superfamily phosphohydrolase/phosphomutase
VDGDKGVRLATAEGVRLDLVPGAWSDLVPVTFAISPIAKVRGRVRFLLESAAEPLRLFATPVQFDAERLPPNVPIASPPSFAAELARVAGPFETIGWPELTNPVKDDVLADRAFLDHLALVREGREKRLMDRIGRDDWDCLFALFSETDRVQHALFRHVDDKSPTHDPKTAPEFAGEIDRAYVEMDRQVGEVVAAVGPEARIVVVSDHGFAPFRRGVNLNNFLVARGFQARRPGAASTLFDIGGAAGLAQVDWSESKAYTMGLGNMYLNLVGREAKGIVRPEDADKVLAAIEKDLLELRDKDGTKVVRRVYRGKDLYHGPRADETPDLVVGFEWGYRVSWQTSLGNLDRDVIVDNHLRWSGDHCSVDPDLVPGVLFSSLPLDPAAKPSVVDVAPSILSIHGLSGPEPDGKSFLAR